MKQVQGLHLEQDSSIPLQSHLDSLTQKATLGFVIIAALTFVFIFKIDSILEHLLTHLSPCNDSSCLTLYEPASWSAVRWLAAVFLSILCILPFALFSVYQFAYRGLTQSERKMLKRWMVSTSILGYMTLFFLFYYLIPELYLLGDQIHTDVGLVSQYDGISLFIFALSLFWAILITYLLSIATISAGALRLITESNQDWWRLRILGFGGLVLLLSLPGRWNGANIIMMSVMFLFLEFSIRKSVRKANEIFRPNAIFDHEGRRRFVTYVDCSCQGVAYPINTTPENTGLLKYASLCDNIDERDHLIDTISRNRMTDVIIGGCDTKPLPRSFQNSITSVNCQLRGLNLLELQGAIPTNHQQLQQEVQIHVENLTDPWTSAQRIQSCANRLLQSNDAEILPVYSKNWPELKEGRTRISFEHWSDDEILHLRKNRG